MGKIDNLIWFDQLTINDVSRVGGKNASLGEMIKHLGTVGIEVPNGFATTAEAYYEFLEQSQLKDKIQEKLSGLDVNDLKALRDTGAMIREWILKAPLSSGLEKDIRQAYSKLINGSDKNFSVAVRSSATAEDLPTASFAGQQETYLNISGIDNVLLAVKQVFASLFNDRAIAYRSHQGFSEEKIALSAGIQKMVRSDVGTSGVMFSIDMESGFPQVVVINAAYGLGEMVVQGQVNPDEFYVYKPALKNNRSAILRRQLGDKTSKMVFSDASGNKTTKIVEVSEEERLRFSISDKDAEQLAHYAVLIEEHYGCPMDIEWVKDGVDGKLYIVQARPETVQSQANKQVIEHFHLEKESHVLATGRSVGQKIGKGSAKVIKNIKEITRVEKGDVLVTDMTDPDWEPIMKRAAAIVTNRGGRTCHAAIIARELGIPAVVGCGDATKKIQDGSEITVSCASGDTGYVYEGLLHYSIERIDVKNMPKLPTKVMMNVGNPERAFAFQSIPNTGIGLARLEFLISNTIGVHPKALLNFDSLPNEIKQKIKERAHCYASPVEFYIEKLREGIATLAAAFFPHPVIVRLSDFKSNEYANLIGGKLYEPEEENPMLGFRGASRYVSDHFRDCFALECKAVKRVREEMGLTNVEVMIPFVRTLEEAKNVIQVLKEEGLERGKDGLRIIMMCEIPSNVILAEEFLEYFDGFSIGSNDLTQLTLGLDRDSALVAEQFDERDPAVKTLLAKVIQVCKQRNKYIGICGQGPSDHPDFAKWLVEQGIDSLSLNPDTVLETSLMLVKM